MVAVVTDAAFHPFDAPRFWRLYLRPRNVDYYAYESRLPLRHTPAFFFAPGYPWYYPAPAVFVHYPFYQLGGYGHRVYLLSAILLCLWLAWHLWRSLVETGLQKSSASLFIGCLLVFAWPEYFAVERGNIEALTWIPVAVGVWWYRRGRRKDAAAALVGIMGSVKLYPLLMIGYFVARRDWRATCVAVLAACATTLLALRFLEPNIAFAAQQILHGMHAWTSTYATISDSGPYDHSAFQLGKLLLWSHDQDLARKLQVFYSVAAPLALLGYWRICKMPALNQVLFLSCAAVTLPPASFDYTLTFLYLPFALFSVFAVGAQQQGRNIPKLSAMFVLFALVLAVLPFPPVAALGDFPGVCKGVCLVALMALSLAVPFRELGRNQQADDESTDVSLQEFRGQVPT